MGVLKHKYKKSNFIDEEFESFFDLGWRFIPQRKNKRSRITDYEVKSPSGKIYSLCKPIKFFEVEPYFSEEFNTEFDYEVSQYNLQSGKINKERKTLSEIIDLIEPLNFKERLSLYKKFEGRVD